MQGAMDRFLTVNDSSSSGGVRDPREFASPASDDSPEPAELSPSLAESTVAGTQGPCLYFGPQGQRCSRPALTGGFCSRHQPEAESAKTSSRGVPRIAAAGIGILAALWPIIFDVLRVIIRWLHAHG
jgi:hypothetical protein